MTKEQREQSLRDARLACQWLKQWVVGKIFDPHNGQIACLVAEFTRLDGKEQKQIKAGKKYGKLGAEHGKKGGRPKNAKP